MARREVDDRAAELARDRSPYVRARVILAERPTSAKAGDEALVLADGTLVGFVGGACAESTVRAQALALLDSGDSLLLRITPEPEPDEEASHGRMTVHNPCLSGGTLEIFLEPVRPAPLVVVAGSTPIAHALGALADRVGFEVVADASGDPAGLDLSGVAAVVVASHGRDEELLLRAAVNAGVPYIGLVASTKRGQAVLASLDVGGSAQVHTPAGLDIGARTPEEIALSILAEIVSLRPRPSGRPMPESAPTSTGTAVDPVCSMTVAMVDSSLHLDHEGMRYWFCGSGCLRAFAAAPADYLK